jgi:hypothetical protein
VYVLEVAARPIGGLCAKTLRFEKVREGSKEFDGVLISLEELLIRHAIGEPVDGYRRETAASAVMMIPIPRRGILKRVEGVDAASLVEGVEDITITAKIDQLLLPLPEGASYLGFIFARRASPDAAVAAVREAHARLSFDIEKQIAVI